MATQEIAHLCGRYKTGYAYVARWILDTAKVTLPSSPTVSSIEKLSTNQLVTIAEAISAAAGPGKPAPEGVDSVLIVLGDVIKNRRQCIRIYRGDGGPQDAEKDRGHEAYVVLLEGIFQSLLQFKERSSQQQEGNSAASKHVQLVCTNPFECLQNEDDGPDLNASPKPLGFTTKTKSRGRRYAMISNGPAGLL